MTHFRQPARDQPTAGISRHRHAAAEGAMMTRSLQPRLLGRLALVGALVLVIAAMVPPPRRLDSDRDGIGCEA
jgi:hypothetical protein